MAEEKPEKEESREEEKPTHEILEALKQKFGERIKDSYLQRERRLRANVEGRDIFEIARYLKEEQNFDHLSSISAVEYEERYEVVYHLWSYPKKLLIQVNASLEKEEEPAIDSLTPLWKSADWHEREAYDMMGIVFQGHPHLRRMFLPQDFEGFPLRKDFQLQPRPWYKEGEQ